MIKDTVDGFVEALHFSECETSDDVLNKGLIANVQNLVFQYFSIPKNVELYNQYTTTIKNGRGFGQSLYFGCAGHGAGFFDEVQDKTLLQQLEQSISEINFYGDVYFDEDVNEIMADNWRFYGNWWCDGNLHTELNKVTSGL